MEPTNSTSEDAMSDPTARRRSLWQWVHGAERDRGAASAEMVGIIFVLALIISATLALATPGGALASSYENLFCRAFSWFGTTCETVPVTGTDRAPDEPCAVQTDSESRSIGVTAVVDVDGGGTVTTERMSDGTYRVTYQANGSVGIGVGVGGGVDVTVNDFTAGGSASASVDGGAIIGGGTTWEFDNKADAERLQKHLTTQLSNDTTPVIGDVKKGWNAIFGDHYEPPAPTEIFGEVGLYGNGSAGASGLTNSVGADAHAAVVLGGRQNLNTGATTVYYQVSIDGSAQASSLTPTSVGTANASGELSGVIAVTLDPSGEYLTNVSFESLAYGAAGVDVSTLFGSNYDPNTSGGTLFNASVDLTGGESAAIAYDLLRSAGVPLPPSQQVQLPGGMQADLPLASAATRFVDAAAERGTMSRLTLDGKDATAFGIDASGKIGIGLGLRYENSSSSRSVVGADYFDGQSWVPWTACVS